MQRKSIDAMKFDNACKGDTYTRKRNCENSTNSKENHAGEQYALLSDVSNELRGALDAACSYSYNYSKTSALYTLCSLAGTRLLQKAFLPTAVVIEFDIECYNIQVQKSQN